MSEETVLQARYDVAGLERSAREISSVVTRTTLSKAGASVGALEQLSSPL